MNTHSNKWTGGDVNFDFKSMDPRILRADGIMPIPVRLSPKTSAEVVLLYIDHTPFVYELARIRPFNMYLKSGMAKTAHGPILFHLFRFCAQDPGTPILLVDAYANPYNTQQMTVWRALSQQSHWHLFLVDSQAEQVGFFEFSNTFNLEQSLAAASDACKGMIEGNFLAAKAEFYDKYTVDDLDEMS